MKPLLVLLFSTLLIGCASLHWSNYYPYSNVRPSSMVEQLPQDFEACLLQFDSILKPEAITHFRQQDSSIAAIQISRSLSAFFINNWYLNYHLTNRSSVYYQGSSGSRTYDFKRPKSTPPIVSDFLDAGIVEPQAMTRILFNGYYQYLNGRKPDWEKAIEHLKAYWVPTYPINRYYALSDSMKAREGSILLDYHYSQLSEQDTVDILYNRSPRWSKKSPDWYFLSGIIQFKIPEDRAINLELISIESEFGEAFLPTQNDTLYVGDTLSDISRGWLARGRKYFRYRTNSYYRQ